MIIGDLALMRYRVIRDPMIGNRRRVSDDSIPEGGDPVIGNPRSGTVVGFTSSRDRAFRDLPAEITRYCIYI